MRRVLPLLATAIFTFNASATALGAPNACEREMSRAAKQYGVPLAVLYAVGLTETGQKGSLRPYALNIEGRASYGEDKARTVAQFHAARGKGFKLIDVGCMQINHHFHGNQFRSVDEMLDPAKNVDYAARFLKELRAREGSWTMAVARYNAGPNNNPAQKQYVCRVLSNMVASGFGGWTKESKAFCGV